MTWQRDKPIIAVVGFNLFTLFVFVTAPVAWNTDNFYALCFLVLLCQFLLFVGFEIGCRTRPATRVTQVLPFFSGDRLFHVIFAIYLLTFPISYAYRMGFSPFDVGGMVTHLLAGLRDPHFGYAWNIDKTTQSPIPWSAYFAVSIFDQLFLVAGFLQWRRLTHVRRAAFAIFVAVDAFYWVGIATTFGVVSLATTFALSTMFWPTRTGRRHLGRAAGKVLLLFCLLAGTIAFFSYNLYRRSNFSEIDVTQYEVAQRPILLHHPSLSLLPEALWPTYIKVVSYIGQGYYHTSVAFDLDFRSTAFLGNNPALISLARAFGVDVWDDTYMHRLHARGVDEYGVWHSAYTWYASDVSFYGVPVVLFVLGYFFGSSWALGLRGDFLSRVVFIMFGNMLLFLFANNTYLSSVFYAFIAFVPLWVSTRVLGIRLVASRAAHHAPLSASGLMHPTGAPQVRS